MPRHLFLLFALLPALSPTAALVDAADHFERTIRPMLAAHCFGCHGPETQKSGLRLDSLAAMRAGGSRGPAVEPGNPDSLLLLAIRQSGDLKMPPEGALSAAEIETLAAWVDSGANWPEYKPAPAPVPAQMLETRARHWAYQPLASPAPPAVQQAEWPRNAIDRFLLARLEADGLAPAPEADRRTLIRRLSYTLTGLPPRHDEVEAFAADDRPEAYTELVERLLDSPHYGERWGRHWLDVVRYTDSFDSRGNDKTDPVEIWRYRDWVVNALNRDMPYDEFVRHQVAGDLIPGPGGDFNRDGLVATGMLAIGHWPQGDADKEKMVTDIVDDQVDVVTRTFLGVTMACARCHDHKFDPFTIEEYYSLAGIFFSSSILPGPGAKTEGSPILHLPLASQETLDRRRDAESRRDALRRERETLLADSRAAHAQAERARTAAYLLATQREAPADPALNPDVLAAWRRALEGGIAPALHQATPNFQALPGVTARADSGGVPSATGNASDSAVQYSTITQPARSVVVHPGPSEGVGVGWRAPAAGAYQVAGRLADADANCGDGIAWTLVHREHGVDRVLATAEMNNGGSADIALPAPVALDAGGQILLTVLPRGEYSCDTTQVDLRIQADGAAWDFAADVLPAFDAGNPWPDAAGNADVWWLYRGAAESHLDPVLFAPWHAAIRDGQRDDSALDAAAAMIQAAINAADQSPPLQAALARLGEPGGPLWIEAPPATDDSPLARANAELAALDAELAQPLDLAVGIQEGGVPETEHAGIHDVAVHRRGSYTNLGPMVPRQMPAIVRGTAIRPVTAGSGRADLAAWLTEECAPLLARVMANRVWQHHVGTGLVRTPGDFGAQGQPPTHPELLDHLAARFIESSWSLKALHREILHSAAFRQSSQPSPEALERDPDNILLARMNRRRLDAESLRDSILAATGQLDRTPGGPAYVDLGTPRRTLYYRTSRSNLNTYTQLFDGADPTSIVPARNESTVAPQALFLLNHPVALRAAEALANAAGGQPMPAPVVEMYRRLYQREPSPDELEFATRALERLGHPDPNALAAFAQVMLSSNAFCFVD
ncbi:MAG: PSD1 domain-containing protein [Candidatus Hydrogenedentes bacterium]|nr:PSD1 domain-containing protein [Candidatus Hydrogenedentota bacterium]